MKKLLILPVALMFLVGCTTTPAEENTEDTVTYSISEVSNHNTQEDCWMVVDGDVYDITSYIVEHPAGADSITRGCGIDDSEAYNSIAPHLSNAVDIIADLYIGELAK